MSYIFNNNPGKRTVKRAYKHEFIIISHYKTVRKAVQAAQKIRRYGNKYASRVCVWYFPCNKKDFEKMMNEKLSNLEDWFIPDGSPFEKMLDEQRRYTFNKEKTC